MDKQEYIVNPLDEPFEGLSNEDWEDLCDYLDTALGHWFENREEN